MKKSIILSIVAVLSFSMAFADHGHAPPLRCEMEQIYKAPALSVVYSVRAEITVSTPMFQETKTVVSTFFSVSVPDHRPGFVYRNVEYENKIPRIKKTATLLCERWLSDNKIPIKKNIPTSMSDVS